MAEIELKGRKIPLLMTSWELKTIQEEIAPMHLAIELVGGMDPDAKNGKADFGNPKQLKALAAMIRILGNAGLEEAGENPDLTEKKIMRSIRPNADTLNEIIGSVMETLADGMKSEIPPKEQDGPVDVTLEEINKKKEPEG